MAATSKAAPVHYWAVRVKGFAYPVNPCRRNTRTGLICGPDKRALLRRIDRCRNVLTFQYCGTDIGAALVASARLP